MTYVTQIKLAAVPGSIGARAADQFDALPRGNCAERKTPRVGVVVKIERPLPSNWNIVPLR